MNSVYECEYCGKIFRSPIASKEHEENCEGNTLVNSLRKVIAELEAKMKWSAGHPEEDKAVLVLRRNIYEGNLKGITRYEVAMWDSKSDSWFFNDDEPGGVGFERQVLGWREIEPFDLPIEPSETIGHLEEEE